MTETTILNEAAVSEIEARGRTVSEWPGVGQFGKDILGLCATVKHLRNENRNLREGLDEEGLSLAERCCGSIKGELARERDDLQSQLEQLRTIAEGALRFRVETNGACNHDEYMTKLCTQCEIRAALEKL